MNSLDTYVNSNITRSLSTDVIKGYEDTEIDFFKKRKET